MQLVTDLYKMRDGAGYERKNILGALWQILVKVALNPFVDISQQQSEIVFEAFDKVDVKSVSIQADDFRRAKFSTQSTRCEYRCDLNELSVI